MILVLSYKAIKCMILALTLQNKGMILVLTLQSNQGYDSSPNTKQSSVWF